MTKIKICGLVRPCDIDYVNEARPDYCGFVIRFPQSHRSLAPAQVRALVQRLSPVVTPVGVFVDRPVEEVADLLNDGTVSIAQLHGQEDEEYLAALRARTGGKPVWKAFQVCGRADLDAAAASSADLVVLDNGCGTGRTFDWTLLRGFSRPFLLAGGLNPENIAQAAAQAVPFGVDLSSGVETEKKKDRAKILAAVAAAREG